MFIQNLFQKILYPSSRPNLYKATNSNSISTSKEKRYKTIQDVTKVLVSKIDFEEMSHIVVDIMINQMDYIGGIMFIPDLKNNVLIPWTTPESPLIKNVLKMLPKGIRQYQQPYDKKTSNLIARSFQDNQPYFSKIYSDFVSPALPINLANVIQNFTGIRLSMSYPITYKNKILGVLMFNSSRNEIGDEEKEMLQTYSELVGIAMNNINLFNELNAYNVTLQKQNHDLESLYKLTSNVSKSLDVGVVSQVAVNSLPQDTTMVGAVLSLYDEKKQLLYIQSLTQNKVTYAVEKIIGDIKQYKIDLNNREYDNHPSRKAFVFDKIYSTSDLTEYLSPPLPKSLVKPIINLLNIKSVVLYPIKRREKVVGTIAYFLTVDDYAELPQNEKNLYSTYTAQIAGALENSFLLKNLEEARQKIEQAYKKERDMMDILGHELRTPLTIARNAILMIDMEYKKEKPDILSINDLLEKAKENIKREIATLQTVLSTTRLENDRAQINAVKVDAKDVVNDSIEALKAEAEKKALVIQTELPEDEVSLWAGREQTQEILDNLLSNAIKYTEKGSITIKLKVEGDFVTFFVKDTGEGIPEDEIQNLGKKFHRINPYLDSGDENEYKVVRPGGTGIGLYVVKGFLQKMGGKFGVESKIGEGSTFSASLPKYTNQDIVKTN